MQKGGDIIVSEEYLYMIIAYIITTLLCFITRQFTF